jgi:hypothetical protein
MKFGEWTKIADQLPPEPANTYSQDYATDYYICTVDNKQVVVLEYVKTLIRGKKVIRWEWHDRISPWEPIAYMPFPEPYKED